MWFVKYDVNAHECDVWDTLCNNLLPVQCTVVCDMFEAPCHRAPMQCIAMCCDVNAQVGDIWGTLWHRSRFPPKNSTLQIYVEWLICWVISFMLPSADKYKKVLHHKNGSEEKTWHNILFFLYYLVCWSALSECGKNFFLRDNILQNHQTFHHDI